jgi:hypothetical protein
MTGRLTNDMDKGAHEAYGDVTEAQRDATSEYKRRMEPTLDRTVGRVHCPTWSLDLFLLQGLPSGTRWLPGQRPVGGARPELVRYHLSGSQCS